MEPQAVHKKYYFLEIEFDPKDAVKQWTECFLLLAFSPSTVFFIQNYFKVAAPHGNTNHNMTLSGGVGGFEVFTINMQAAL